MRRRQWPRSRSRRSRPTARTPPTPGTTRAGRAPPAAPSPGPELRPDAAYGRRASRGYSRRTATRRFAIWVRWVVSDWVDVPLGRLEQYQRPIDPVPPTQFRYPATPLWRRPGWLGTEITRRVDN